jgi:hypothetical protein
MPSQSHHGPRPLYSPGWGVGLIVPPFRVAQGSEWHRGRSPRLPRLGRKGLLLSHSPEWYKGPNPSLPPGEEGRMPCHWYRGPSSSAPQPGELGLSCPRSGWHKGLGREGGCLTRPLSECQTPAWGGRADALPGHSTEWPTPAWGGRAEPSSHSSGEGGRMPGPATLLSGTRVRALLLTLLGRGQKPGPWHRV